MVNVGMRTDVVFHVNTETETGLEVLCRNIRSVRDKVSELFDNVCSVDFQIVCLTEIL
jgi:hypothetical protein